MNFYDVHNHFHSEDLRDHQTAIMEALGRTGVAGAVVNGTCEEDWDTVAQRCANANPQVGNAAFRWVPSFGLHPWDVGNRTSTWQDRLIGFLDAMPSAGVGEIGLDRWMLERARPNDRRLAGLRRAPLPEQIEVFRAQFNLAVDRQRAISIHCLEAFGALLEELKFLPNAPRGLLLHAYSGPVEMVPAFADHGAYFSFNGAFMESRKQRLRDVFANIPLDRLLVETDAPAMRLPPTLERFYLPAANNLTAPNHPANLVAAYEALAELRQISVEVLAESVEANFLRLFGTA
jgi:TatD DNase family protein